MKRHTIAALLCVFASQAEARGFRGFTPIATPDSAPIEARQALPANAQPVSRAVGTAAVKQLVEGWNSGQLAGVVSEEFFDKSRLLDAIDADVPRDAELRLISVRSVQTLSQYVEDDPQFGPVLVSEISATARTQIEFNDPTTGALVNRPGENEFILRVRQRAGQ